MIRLVGPGNMGRAFVAQLKEQCLHIGRGQSPLEKHSSEDILILAVKPKDFNTLDLKAFKGKLVISLLAGITTSKLQAAIPHTPCLRTMPNLAVRCGKGIVILAQDPKLDRPFIEQLLSPLGHLEWAPETQFDALTALAGSGPAFQLAIVEAMEQAGAQMGLTSDHLVPLMIEGALALLKEAPARELIKQIASPNGTTQAGLEAFERAGVSAGIIETFVATYNRSMELSN